MKLTLLRSQSIGDEVVSYTFTPEEPIHWVAGQSVRLEIPSGYGSEEKRFTISSAPYEQEITISTRISPSAFKQALNNLQPGTNINGYSVEGTFTWPDDRVKEVVFVAAGIGITPYISMLKQRSHQQLPLNATVIFASGRKEFPFAATLKAMQRAHSELTVVWQSNRISAEDITAYATPESLLYLSGPENMISSLTSELTNRYNVPKERVKQDLFSGQLIG